MLSKLNTPFSRNKRRCMYVSYPKRRKIELDSHAIRARAMVTNSGKLWMDFVRETSDDRSPSDKSPDICITGMKARVETTNPAR